MDSDPADAASLQAWLAAYAVGLAVRVDGAPDAAGDAVTALARAADDDASVLARARIRLTELVTLDPRIRDGASTLLDRAAAAALSVCEAC